MQDNEVQERGAHLLRSEFLLHGRDLIFGLNGYVVKSNSPWVGARVIDNEDGRMIVELEPGAMFDEAALYASWLVLNQDRPAIVRSRSRGIDVSIEPQDLENADPSSLNFIGSEYIGDVCEERLMRQLSAVEHMVADKEIQLRLGAVAFSATAQFLDQMLAAA